jgi:regulator of protease activity HflC (stomatin/prohibitin superfamily)
VLARHAGPFFIFTMTVTIYEHQAGLHFQRGELVATLSSGRYRFWGKAHRVIVLDKRDFMVLVGGQELACSDGAPFRMSVLATCRIEDAEKAYRAGVGKPDPTAYYPVDNSFDSQQGGVAELGTSDWLVKLHAQVAMREWASNRTLDETHAQRHEAAGAIADLMRDNLAGLGYALINVSMLDFSLAGNLKSAYTDVLKAELEGRAALARARNEASTMRSLINTSRLVRENPGLLELRILTAGQRPRVNFNLAPPTSEVAPTDTE